MGDELVHVFVEGIFEWFSEEGLWEKSVATEPLEVLTIGDRTGYRYALLVGSDVPVRWMVGAGAFGTTVTSVEQVYSL